MMRSWVLLFVLMFIVLTSQFEWNEQLGSEIETIRPMIISDKEQHRTQGKESVQEKKILSQERKIPKLNELVQDLRRQLVQCKNENQNVENYQGIIKMSKTSMNTKQLASQLIPRYFKFFPSLSTDAFDAHMDCIDDGDLGVRVQAIRGLPCSARIHQRFYLRSLMFFCNF